MSPSSFSEGWKLVCTLLFYFFCYIKHIGYEIWRLMPRHLTWIHLLLQAAWMTAQRKDTSTGQKPPTTQSCLLAMALCLLWQGTQVTRSKSDSDWGLQLWGIPGTMSCPIMNYICKEKQQGLLLSFPPPRLFYRCAFCSDEKQKLVKQQAKPSSASACFEPSVFNQREATWEFS